MMMKKARKDASKTWLDIQLWSLNANTKRFEDYLRLICRWFSSLLSCFLQRVATLGPLKVWCDRRRRLRHWRRVFPGGCSVFVVVTVVRWWLWGGRTRMHRRRRCTTVAARMFLRGVVEFRVRSWVGDDLRRTTILADRMRRNLVYT